MTDVTQGEPITPWDGSVLVGTVGTPFAYVPDQVLVRGDVDPGALSAPGEEIGVREVPIAGWQLLIGRFDVLRVVESLRVMGVTAQPNHVMFAHAHDGCGCCHDHPADLLATPLRATPLRATPLRATPLRATPLRATPLRATGIADLPTSSSARPAPAPAAGVAPAGGETVGTVLVLDTGLAAGNLRPAALHATSAAAQTLITGAPDRPDIEQDGWLDPVAGHGTFIAGLIHRHGGPARIHVAAPVKPKGQVDELSVASIITNLVAAGDIPDIVVMPFGGSVWDEATLLKSAVLALQTAGAVVVASAGNDGSCAPFYPAAFTGVVSVGSIGPDGPSYFTNYGPWVRACAPGEDLVSTFFTGWNGAAPSTNGTDVDKFAGWARWSGTSFAAPVVAAALLREMRRSGSTAAEAVAAIIDAPHLGRIPGLGTVVNL